MSYGGTPAFFPKPLEVHNNLGRGIGNWIMIFSNISRELILISILGASLISGKPLSSQWLVDERLGRKSDLYARGISPESSVSLGFSGLSDPNYVKSWHSVPAESMRKRTESDGSSVNLERQSKRLRGDQDVSSRIPGLVIAQTGSGNQGFVHGQIRSSIAAHQPRTQFPSNQLPSNQGFDYGASALPFQSGVQQFQRFGPETYRFASQYQDMAPVNGGQNTLPMYQGLYAMPQIPPSLAPVSLSRTRDQPSSFAGFIDKNRIYQGRIVIAKPTTVVRLGSSSVIASGTTSGTRTQSNGRASPAGTLRSASEGPYSMLDIPTMTSRSHTEKKLRDDPPKRLYNGLSVSSASSERNRNSQSVSGGRVDSNKRPRTG